MPPHNGATDELGASLPESAWKFVSRDATHVTSEAWLDEAGGTRIRRRQFIGDDELQKINKFLYDSSGTYSQRSMGAMGTPIANVPLSVMYNKASGIMDNIRAGNKDHLTWWLNREENQKFRTFKGKE